ncbi:sodium:proton antiporter [Bacteroidota bacterium]
MKKIFLFSTLLIIGLVGSQILPGILGSNYVFLSEIVTFLTMTGLAFIMIHVGYEFEINKKDVKGYGWDYLVAMTTAGFPWIFATAYFVFVLQPVELWDSWTLWKESLLIGRFAAPTASGVLFAMLAAAGLSATWMFKKTRILVIFDDLDTVLLMIPLKIFMVGLAWQLGIAVLVMIIFLWIAWQYLHKISIPVTWKWVLLYSVAIAGISELIYYGTSLLDESVPIHLEVLLPAFVLGAIMKRPEGTDSHLDDERDGHQEGLESPEEQKVAGIVSSVFMLLVGLSMPLITVGTAEDSLSWSAIIMHVLILTVLINIGKMVPAFTYKSEAKWQERMAVAVGMWPRGEVGAGVIILSLSYGIVGPMVSIAVLSLALNLLLTPLFIYFVIKLLKGIKK